MPERPYTLLSCGMSIDGYIDTATDERLVLSNDADLDRVDAVRADSDAILVGAATLRNDNPGCWCVRRRGAPSASPAACRQLRSR
jgi:5-amino-6-(5-phosphoribosylamino)uracil reductase